MELADDPTHWASSLHLPWPLSYRVVHRKLGLVVHSHEVPRNAAHTYHTPLPSEGVLFAGETYELEVGYTAKEQVGYAARELDALLEGRAVTFNGPGDPQLPSVSRAWSIDYLFDDGRLSENHA
eukprot:1258822-Prymnesium_polylepis.1